jgi:hypothetical protein
MGLTRKISRITRQNLVDEISLIHLDHFIVSLCPLAQLGDKISIDFNPSIDGFHTPKLVLNLPLL